MIQRLGNATEPSEVCKLFKEIAATHNPEYLPALITKIKSTAADPSFNSGWLESMLGELGRLGSRDAVDFLIATLEWRMPGAVRGAVYALELLGDKRAEEPLLKAFSTCLPFPDAPIVDFLGTDTKAFCEALLSLGSQAVTKVMIANLDAVLSRQMPTSQQLHDSTMTAEALAKCLGQTGDKSAVDILLRTLGNWFPGTVHIKTVWSLKKLGVAGSLRETILQTFSKMLSSSPWAGDQKKREEELKTILWILDR